MEGKEYSVAGSELFICPNLFNVKKKLSSLSKNDIYSLGVLLFYFRTGEVLFRYKNKVEMIITKMMYATDEFYEGRKLNYVSDEFKELINGMLDLIEEDRYDIKQVLEHSWLNQKFDLEKSKKDL